MFYLMVIRKRGKAILQMAAVKIVLWPNFL